MGTLDYQRILDAFADPVVAIHGYRDRQPDTEPGRIIYANRAAETLLGWPAGTLVGRPVTDIMPPRFRPQHTAGLQRYLQTHVPHLIGHALKAPALCHDGSELEIELNLSVVPGGIAGEGEVVVAALRDLHERVELERQLAVMKYLRASTAMAATLASRLNLDDVLQTVVETLVRDFDALLARVWLYDDTANALHPRASAGSTTATAASARARIDVATYPYKVGVVARTRQPFVKNGLAGDPEFDQPWIAREGVAAVGVFPLLARDQLLGVLACFSRVEFPPEVVEVLNALVGVVTASLNDVRHLQREQEARAKAEAAERRLATVATSLDRALAEAELLNAITTAAAGEEALDRILTVSLDYLHRAVNFTGGSIALVEGDDLVLQAAVGPFADRALGQRLPRQESATWRVVATGEPFLSPDVLAAGLHPTTDIRSYLAVPLRWRGTVYGFLELDSTTPDAFSQDDLVLLRKVAAALSGPIELARRYTREVQATASAEAARRRLAFLSEASTVLASSLDYEATLASIAWLAVPDLADWCVVDIIDEHGALRRLNVAHADPTKAEWARELERRYPPVDDPAHIVVRALRTGRSLLATEVPDAVLSAVARDAEHLRILRALGIKSHLIVPLVARGRALGALTFVAAESGRRYTAEDLTLAEDLARRVAVAIDNAQLYREAQRAQRRQAESLALLDTLLATAPVGFGVWDREFRYLRINASLAAINGLPPEAHLGRTVREVLPALADEIYARFARVLETGQPVLDVEVTGETPAMPGVTRHWLTSYYPVRIGDDEIVAIGGVVTEITERKRAEEARRFLSEASDLLAASLDYRTTLESVAKLAVPYLADWCAIDVVEDDGTIAPVTVAHVDPNKVELARELQRRYPPDPTAVTGVPAVIRTGRPLLAPTISEAQLSAAARDAEHLAMVRRLGLVSYLCVPLLARQRTLGAITLVTAESGRRYGPADLALVEELARRAALAVDNARLYREAREAIQVRDRFLTIAAHELRTPITTVRGNTELLLRRVERTSVPLDRDWLAERLRRLMAGVERLHALAARVLDLNNLQAGVFNLAREECDLTAIVAGVVDRLRTALPPGSRTRFDFSHPAEPVVGEWDPVRLEQVVMNLLQNAMKYQPAGGVVRVTLEATADEALLRVRDQGIGIAEEDLPRLFAPFARADTARQREIGGVGLGLYISSQLIRLHGGSIDVSSVVGEGSEFTIRLPRVRR